MTTTFVRPHLVSHAAGVAGLDVASLTLTELIERTMAWTADGGFHVAVGVNAYVCNQAARLPQFDGQLKRTDLLYADGKSVVWAGNLMGTPIPERLATTDIAVPMARVAADRGVKMFFFGAAPGVAALAAQKVREQAPGLQIDSHHGYVSEEEQQALIDQIRDFGTKILFVGLGDPRQLDWVFRYRDQLMGITVFTCGGLFDWLSGRNRRAPLWMIESGLEWLWRLVIEPRRLAKRYLIGNPEFMSRVISQHVRSTFPRRARRIADVKIEALTTTAPRMDEAA